MQEAPEKIETIHLYVVREDELPPHLSLLPVFLSLLVLLGVVTIGVFTPYVQPVTRTTIRVPAVLLPLKTFTASVAIIPTGIKTYPATTSHGTLTITNGSVISQTLPAGLTFLSKSGVSVVTDTAVFVPAGNANGYGFATVAAHALLGGKQGNIPAFAINRVEGSSVYVRNLTAFRGGRDAFVVQIATMQDRHTAVDHARQELTYLSAGLHYSCTETISGAVAVTWRCQFISYHVPSAMHVTGITFLGKNLLLAIWFVARPTRIWVK